MALDTVAGLSLEAHDGVDELMADSLIKAHIVGEPPEDLNDETNNAAVSDALHADVPNSQSRP